MQGHERNRHRRRKIQKSLYEVSFFLELIVALLVICVILLEIFSLATHLKETLFEGSIAFQFTYLLKLALDIAISIEFLKMLCRYNMDSVIEVLLFAMARHLIVEETTMIDGLLCIIAVAVLFVVRKYLFVPKIDKFDNDDEISKKTEESAPDETAGNFLEKEGNLS